MGASLSGDDEARAEPWYRMVGANLYGFNLFFARSDVAELLPAIEVDELFRHGSYRR